jgi:hypothetical protein
MPDYFDCGTANGDPTGRVMPAGFPEPAQQAVIPAVVQEKLTQIDSGKKLEAVKLWKPADPDHPLYGRVFIMDGQHRFVAACIKGLMLEVIYKKFGTAGYTNGWVTTSLVETTPAKETLRAQVAAAQANWPSAEPARSVKEIILKKNMEGMQLL